MLRLVHNEVLKLVRRGRFTLVLAILALFACISTWAQHRQQQNRSLDQPGVTWQTRTARRILEIEQQVEQRRIFVGFTRVLRFEARRLDYHLQQGINPEALTGPLLMRGMAIAGSTLLIPLLIALLSADLVSSESSSGTVKLLLTRPVPRWKVFASKALTMGLFTSLTLLAAACITWLIGGIAFGHGGFGAPVLSGLRASDQGVDVAAIRIVPLWLDTLASYGLAWLAALCVGSLSLLTSVLFRSTAASLGALLATLVAGSLLAQLAGDFEPAKWFFVTALPLPQYYAGVPAPLPGMTIGFCCAVLTAWSAGALCLAAGIFCRRDVTS
jgi:ABC-2 type transport system permease protein